MAAFLKALKQLLEHRHLPAALALLAVLVMLPALKLGLFADDLPQRLVELRPEQLPLRIHATGNPLASGSLPTVLRDLFYHRSPQDTLLMRHYGTLPWWTPEHFRIGLWRPVAAFTHWLDYRLFPDSPLLMHLHSIAWFTAIVFLLAGLYRKLMGPSWIAGLAALLFLLDANTYYPVALVANRGFLMALCFGLVGLQEHHRWRSAASRSGCWLSALFLLLALLANEGGASTLAFLVAYALVLEPGSWRHRARTLLPALLVLVLWRALYEAQGFGLNQVGFYLDPAHEPLAFARAVLPRTMLLLAGQLPGLSPDLLMAFSPSLYAKATVVYVLVTCACLAILWPWVRRNQVAAFWFAAMVLAAVPAATVAPLSKNLGFVAVGGSGLLASFVGGLTSRSSPMEAGHRYRAVARVAAVLLMLVHIPVALAARAQAARALPLVAKAMDRLAEIGQPQGADNKHVVVLNAPWVFTLSFAPALRVLHHQPLPKTLRTLMLGCTGQDLVRTDAATLIMQAKGADLFSCDPMGPVHACYVFRNLNLLGRPRCRPGDRFDCGSLQVEVLAVDGEALPARVAFRFDHALDAPDFQWLQFNWRTFSYEPFPMMAIGQSASLAGPKP